jgi:diazepam-binding inhibitor (GABA receptor modulating acyl-CoA-binding protein)
MSTLAEKFTAAQERAKTLSARPSNEDLLALYALFKQGTTGDVQGSRPGMFDLKGRAKFDAWSGKKGLSTEQAQQAYVDLVERLAAKG